jgi:long-subunit acyl-CoA synthetase (AMP-forming)
MLYTGGTTGMPKGVMWRQGDLIAVTDTNRRPGPPRRPRRDAPSVRARRHGAGP